jgi:hypothetical protein
MIDLRCPSKKHGSVIGKDVVEVKCNSRFCGARRGVIVLHRFNTVSGDLLDTKRYKEIRS